MALFVLAGGGVAGPARAGNDCDTELDISRIYIEYNFSGNDLGFHVFLDGEDWVGLEIENPDGLTIFEVEGRGAYADLGLTELFFEGAEPSLDDVPLGELLEMFPEGEYEFEGQTVDGCEIEGTGILSHKIPAPPTITAPGPNAPVNPDKTVIQWTAGSNPSGVKVVGYQVIVESFQVTLPASRKSVTVPPEFMKTLKSGVHQFEVLAIEKGGNQTIREGSFRMP
jgi:hypothetical protein